MQHDAHVVKYRKRVEFDVRRDACCGADARAQVFEVFLGGGFANLGQLAADAVDASLCLAHFDAVGEFYRFDQDAGRAIQDQLLGSYAFFYGQEVVGGRVGHRVANLAQVFDEIVHVDWDKG